MVADAHMYSVAVHEAGHVVALSVFGIDFESVWIDLDEQCGRVEADITFEGKSFDQLRQYAVMYFAAWEAQLIHEHDLDENVFKFSLESDRVNAGECVKNAVQGPTERQELFAAWRNDAKVFALDHWPAIQRVGHQLYLNKRLTAAAVHAEVNLK